MSATVEPSGCALCGTVEREHPAIMFCPKTGTHSWTEPSMQLRRERIEGNLDTDTVVT